MVNTYHRLFFHCVWTTWDREPLLTGEVEREAYALMRAQCARMGATLHAIGGVADHVHLLVGLPTTLCLADFAEAVKGVTSKALNDRALNDKAPDDRRRSPAWAFKWRGGYSAFTVCAAHVPPVRRYIEGQKRHHADHALWPSCEPDAT